MVGSKYLLTFFFKETKEVFLIFRKQVIDIYQNLKSKNGRRKEKQITNSQKRKEN